MRTRQVHHRTRMHSKQMVAKEELVTHKLTQQGTLTNIMLLCRTNWNSPASSLPATFIYHLTKKWLICSTELHSSSRMENKENNPAHQASYSNTRNRLVREINSSAFYPLCRQLTGLSFKVDHSGMIFKDLKTNKEQQSQ